MLYKDIKNIIFDFLEKCNNCNNVLQDKEKYFYCDNCLKSKNIYKCFCTKCSKKLLYKNNPFWAYSCQICENIYYKYFI